MSALRMDLRFALRTLRRTPAFTVAALLALVLAIGANTSVFGVVNALLNFSIPFEDAEDVAFLFPVQPEQNINQGGVSPAEFEDYRAGVNAFESLHAFSVAQYNLQVGGAPRRVGGTRVTPGFFAMSGRLPLIGRGFTELEGSAGMDRVVVLDHGFWRQDLGGDEAILGTTLSIDGEPYEVVGVTQEGFALGNAGQIWIPLVLDEEAMPRDQRLLAPIGRLKAGQTADEATVQARLVAERLAAAYPDIYRGWTARVITVGDSLNQGTRLVRVLLYAAISFVLLIACANIANLLLARMLSRGDEFALRACLGAGRLRIVRQLLIESLVLALIGGGLGLLVGAFGVRMLRNWFAPDPNIGFIADLIRMDQTVVLHSLAIAVLAALLFGLVPALRAASGSLSGRLRGGAKHSGGKQRQVFRGVLITTEVALAMALLITAGTLIRAFVSIYEADPGFEVSGLFTAQVALPDAEYPEEEQVQQFYSQALEEIRALPGVDGAASTTSLPLTQFPGPGTARIVTDRTTELEEDAPNALDVVVAPGYFAVMEIPVLHGRGFAVSDRAETEPVAIVTEDFAALHWPGESGLDRRVQVTAQGSDGDQWRRVVGVVGKHESHAHSLRTPARMPQIFLPAAQAPKRTMNLVIRGRNTEQLAPSLRTALARLDPELPLTDPKTLARRVEEIDTQNRVFLRILVSLAVVALLLAAIGIYGMIAYGVSQRRREISIRAALGARPSSTIRLVARGAAWLTGVGLLIGCGLGLALVRFMGSQLEGIGSTGSAGPATFLVLSLLFLGIAVTASLVPTRRALKVDPAGVLRDG